MNYVEYRNGQQEAVAAAIDAAEEIQLTVAEGVPQKPRLLVENCNPDVTVARVRDVLAEGGELFERGGPVRLVLDQNLKGTIAQMMTPHGVVFMAHGFCRPYAVKLKHGVLVEDNVRLPHWCAIMYLDWRGQWQLRPLNGIASAPLLHDDGTINNIEGYDQPSGMWCENMPDLSGLIPDVPTRDTAEAALQLIRETFRTFCYADAETLVDPSGITVVDTSKPPRRDEFSFLAALLTAVCRPSLYLAPGVLMRAAPMSGAGAGKGLLARCICVIAFGRDPHAVTSGATPEELEKRIAAELMGGGPVLFLDNLNNTAFKSDLLASAITERPARVRLLGKSQMVPLNASALVILTGNGLSVSEDLARRFIMVEFDPRTEDPEARQFKSDIRAEVRKRRNELLAAVLTIWRWGRIAVPGIKPAQELGSFEQWCRWVRDPLLALGCYDPVERVSEAKARDGRRQEVGDLFTLWWDRHGDQPMGISQLHDDVTHVANSQGRSRQYLASYLASLVGTRMGGFVLTRQVPVGKWGKTTYSLKMTAEEAEHRGHGGIGIRRRPMNKPMAQTTM